MPGGLRSRRPAGLSHERQAMTPVNDFMTTAEVAARLGVTGPWVTRLARQGRFPNARQIGGIWLIPRADVEHYEATRRPPGNPEWRGEDDED